MLKKILVTSLLAFSAMLLIGCSLSGGSSKEDSIHIGWTEDTENSILANMIVHLAEDLDIPVEVSSSLGGTGIAHDSIIAGEMDVYVDYTGDALVNVLKLDPITEPNEAYEAVKEAYLDEYDISWLEPTPFNNTYALALPRDRAEEHDIVNVSDFANKAADWKIGSSIEFANREIDGYPGMVETYGYEFADIKPMDTGLMYTAIDGGEVDVIVAFATDARIGKFDLKVIEDDLNFFPSYNAAPTVRSEILKKYPEIEDKINEIFQNLDTDTMIDLNGQVDLDNENPEDVAKDYLIDNGYIE